MKRYSVWAGIFIFLGAVFLAATVQAQPPPHREGIHHRVHAQQERINRLVASGGLTRREAHILQDNLNYVRRTYDRYTRDGMLTHREEHRLHRMLDDNAEMIRDMKRRAARRLY